MGAPTPNLNLAMPDDGDQAWGNAYRAAMSTLDTLARRAVVSKTANYVATVNDSVILVDATSGNLQITLPAPALGLTLTVKKIDSSVNTVTVITPSGTIDGASSAVMNDQNEARDFVATASNWYLV